jgi:hypothetical protein
MLILANVGKAERKPTASATNEVFMPMKARIRKSSLLIICKILAEGWTIWLMDGFDMHIYGTL